MCLLQPPAPPKKKITQCHLPIYTGEESYTSVEGKSHSCSSAWSKSMRGSRKSVDISGGWRASTWPETNTGMLRLQRQQRIPPAAPLPWGVCGRIWEVWVRHCAMCPKFTDGIPCAKQRWSGEDKRARRFRTAAVSRLATTSVDVFKERGAERRRRRRMDGWGGEETFQRWPVVVQPQPRRSLSREGYRSGKKNAQREKKRKRK